MLFRSGWLEAVESVHDIRRVAAESTRVPDLHHRHERVPCIPCTPPTSTTRSRARTQALGEQTRDLLDLWHLVEHLVRVPDELALER